MSAPEQLDRARRALEAISVARRTMDARWLALGEQLVTLRDEELYEDLGYRTLTRLVADQLPTMDPRDGRTAIRVLTEFASLDGTALMRAGVARLALLAEAHPEDRAALLPMLGDLPYVALQAAIEERVRERMATDTRAMAEQRGTARRLGMPDTSPDTPDVRRRLGDPFRRPAALPHRIIDPDARRDAARTAVDAARLQLAERDEAAWRLSVALAEVGDHRLWRVLGHATFDAFLSQGEVDVPRTVALRYVRLAHAFADADPRVRTTVGLGRLLIISTIDDPATRRRLLDAAADGLGFAELYERRRVWRHERERAETARKIGAPDAVVLVDADIAKAPFNFIFGTDPAGGPFYDATDLALVEQMLLRYSSPGDLVLDLTAGIGTVAHEARRLHRRCRSFDIIDPPLSPDIEVADTTRMTLPPAAADLVFVHLPEPNGKFVYSEVYSRRPSGRDLSGQDYASAMRGAEAMLRVAFAGTRKGGRLVVVTRDTWTRDGTFHDMTGHCAVIARRVGWRAIDKMHLLDSAERRAALLRGSEGYRAGIANRLLPVVSTALIFQRPEDTDA